MFKKKIKKDESLGKTCQSTFCPKGQSQVIFMLAAQKLGVPLKIIVFQKKKKKRTFFTFSNNGQNHTKKKKKKIKKKRKKKRVIKTNNKQTIPKESRKLHE